MDWLNDIVANAKKQVLTGEAGKGMAELEAMATFTPEPTNAVKEFGKGVVAGTLQLPQMAGGLVKVAGDLVGSETVADIGEDAVNYWGEKTAPYTPRVGSIEDVENVGDFVDYAAAGIGSLVPTVAASMIGGGGAAAIAGKSALKSAAKKELTREATEALVSKAVTRGAMAGAGSTSAGMEIGSIGADQMEAGTEDPIKAILYGSVAGALDILPVTNLLAKFPAFKSLQKIPLFKSPEGRAWYTRGVMEGFKQSGMEGAQEAAQTMLERAGASREVFSDQGMMEILNAGIIGAIGGGVMGGGAGVLSGRGKERVTGNEENLETQTPGLNPAAVQPDPFSDAGDPPHPVVDLESQENPVLPEAPKGPLARAAEAAGASIFPGIGDVVPGSVTASVPPIGGQTSDELVLDEARDWAEEEIKAGKTHLMRQVREHPNSYALRILDSFKRRAEVPVVNQGETGPKYANVSLVNPETGIAEMVTPAEVMDRLKTGWRAPEAPSNTPDVDMLGSVTDADRGLLQSARDRAGYWERGSMDNGQTNKNELFPWLKDWGKTTPAEVSKAIGNFLEGKNLGEVQQRLVTAALQFERESRQPRGAAPAQGIGDLIAERRGVKGVAKEQGAGNRGNLESQASNLEPAVLKKAQLYAEKAGLDLDGWSNDEISDFVGKYDSFVKSKSRAAEPIASIGDLIAQRRAMNQKKGTPGIEAGAHEAATSPLNDLAEPSEAQVKAGNYRKGHVSIQGLDISIENPAGSVRSGKDQNGKPWSTAIHHHYGYIKGTVGKDKDHIDTFIGDKPEGDRVFVVDQIDPKSGTFDEHKVMIGFDSKNEATLGYLRNYDDTGQTRIGDVSEMTMDDFKAWLKSGKTKTPVGQLKRGDESQGKGKPAVQPANEARGKIVAKLKASGADEATAGKIADLIAEEYAGKKTLGPAWLGKRIKEGWIDKWKVQTQLKSGGKELEDLSPKEIAALPEGKVDHPVTAALKGKGADLDKQQGEAKEKAEIGGVSDKELDDKAANEALREKVADLGEARSTSTDEVQAKNKERFKEAQRKHLRKKIAEARSEADKTRLAKLLGKLQERKQEITEKPATSIDDEVKNLSLDDLSAMFDEVAAESQPKVETRTVEQATPGTSSRMSLKETVHSKKGHTLFVVTMNERVERDEYDRLNRDAKRTGNGYSSYRGHGAVPGFQFLDKSAAEEFMQRWGGEGKAVETLDVSKEDPQQARTATEILKEAASQGIEGVGDAVTGLYELFGGAALKSFPGGLDEATYSKAKPHFQAAFDRFREAGKGIKEFFRFLIEQFGPGIKPYSMKFVAELQGNSFKELNKTRGSLTESASNDNIVNENSTINEEGTDRDDTGNGGNGPQALESVPSGDVPGDGETRRPDKRVGSSGKTDATRDGYIDDERDDGIGSLGSVEVPVHLQRPVEGLQPGLEHVPTPASEPRSLFLSGENPGNYRIAESDRIGEGTRGQRIDSNMAAIRIAKQLQAEGRYATRTEQSALARYVGWGGLKSVFDPTSTKPQDQKARAELESLLTKEEYFEARQSVLNAHYTSREVIGAIYDMARHFGFSGGNVLEPTFGIGNFIGFMPSELAASSKWYGAELDPITAVIGKHLYPDSQLLNVGFQQAEFPYNKFDLAIGNPPFGDERITDTNKRRSEIDGMKIHNYVIAKAGMHLKPGKLMAMVVTSRFLDTANPEARGHLAKDFSFLGAIRLPNNAFAKSAGTDVVTDLVFFRKLMPDEKPDLSADWLTTGATLNNEDGEAVTLNKYFAERPHLMIGKPSMQGSMYGGGARGDQFTLSAREGQDTGAYIESLLGKDFASLKDVLKERVNDQAEAAAVSLEMNREDVGVGGYVPEGSDVFMREDDDADGNPVFVKLTAETQWTEKTKLGKTRLDRIKGMLELRGQTYKLIEMERFDQPGIERHRTQLNRLYDAFVKAHGYINDSANAGLMADDVKIEFGLEVNYRKPISVSRAKSMGVKPQGAKADKASLLKERVFYPQKEITTAANARDGYGISLSEKGRLDLEYIARLTGKEKKEVITELADEGLILQDPETLEWVQEDEYLSGNVKAKLKSVQHREGYERNAAALKKVQPKDVATDDIFADLGSTWIPAKVYEDFADLMGIKGAKAHVSDATGTVTIVDHKSINQNDMNVLLKNDDYTIAELFNFIANKRAVVAYDHDSEGKRFVNKDRTKLLVPIAKRFTATFRDWIMADPMRAQELTKLYNDTQNTHAERVFDGKHLKTVGANPAIIMRNTQRNAAWRMIQAPVTLLDHVVGSGKTYTIITGIMERRRLGLSRKPLVVVPNHLVGQWAKDFLRLYPGANILAATEKDFSKPNRRRLFSRIATGNFDAVIVGHSSFGFIPLEQETEIKFVQEEMEYLERALSDAASAEDKRTVRTLTNRIAKKRERIARLQNRDRDNVATFESMGIDHLTVDESHEFKNLEYSTSMQNVTGMGSPAGAKKSFDLYAKIRYLRSEDGAVTFATGTPISNSLVEMYTLLRYLNLEGLKERRLDAFDAWAKSYAGIETRIEYTATQKLKERGVMAEFNNLPELLQLYTEFADIVSMSDLKRIYAEQIRESNRATGANEREEFPVPKVKDGARVLDIADPLASQREFMDYLVARATRLERLGGQNDPKIDNHLWVMNDARKMALDIRLVDPLAPADPNNKIGRSAKNIKRIYDKWTADKGTQLVFCDLSTPAKQSDKDAKKFIKDSLTVLAMQKDTRVQAVLDSLTWREQWSYLKNRMEAKVEELNNALQENSNLSDADEKSLNNWMNDLEKYLEEVSDEDEAALTTADTGFSVYDDLKSQLVSMGIPENEIRFIHEANTKDKKEELFGMVNSGEVRVLLGSSKKMGAGTNVQERVVALHHLDAPWRPSDVEQREGRAVRQGNTLYDRDPDGFELELIAYSTGNTFDAVMWQVLARKAEMLEQFRSGVRSVQEGQSDADSYATFMAESTGNPAFKEKYRLENAIEELEGMQRNVQARRSAAERLAGQREELTNKTKLGIDRAAADLEAVAEAEGFVFEGVTYAEDLDEAQAAAREEYNAAWAMYEKELKEHNGRRTAAIEAQMIKEFGFDKYELRGNEVEKIAIKKWDEEHKAEKPVAPKEVTLTGLAKTSQAAKLGRLIEKHLDEMDEGEIVVKYGGLNVAFTVDEARWGNSSLKKGERKTNDYSITVGNYSESYQAKHPSSKEIVSVLRNGAIKRQLAKELGDAKRQAEYTSKSIADAERILDKVKFSDAAELEEKRSRYVEVVEEVNRLEAEMETRRENESNPYIDRDSRRFSGYDRRSSAAQVQESGAAGETRYSVTADQPTYGLPAADIQTAFEPVYKNMPNSPPWRVVQTTAELPKRALDNAAKRGIPQRMLQAVYLGNEVVYVADNFRSMEEAKEVILEEVVVHHGLRGIMAKDAYEKHMLQAALWYANKRNAEWKDLAEQYKLDLKDRDDRIEAAEEMLGRDARTGMDSTILSKVIAAVKEFLRSVGWNAGYGDAEIRELLGKARRFVEGKEQGAADREQGTGIDYGAMLRILREQGVTDDQLEAFANWQPGAARYAAAWHGSPHDFVAFKSQHIGSGEGAQAYGYGLYFAGNKEVAEYYKKAVAALRTNMSELAETLKGVDSGAYSLIEKALTKDDFHGTGPLAVGSIVQSLMSGQPSMKVVNLLGEDFKRVYDAVDSLPSKGKLYHVELAPSEDEYLLWDKHLSEQSEKVKAAIAKGIKNHQDEVQKDLMSYYAEENKDKAVGGTFYKTLTSMLGDGTSTDGRKEASEYLHSLGIRGIKYLDGTSRNKSGYKIMWENGQTSFEHDKAVAESVAKTFEAKYGKATITPDDRGADYNYVIFDESDVSITAKFALARLEDVKGQIVDKGVSLNTSEREVLEADKAKAIEAIETTVRDYDEPGRLLFRAFYEADQHQSPGVVPFNPDRGHFAAGEDLRGSWWTTSYATAQEIAWSKGRDGRTVKIVALPVDKLPAGRVFIQNTNPPGFVYDLFVGLPADVPMRDVQEMPVDTGIRFALADRFTGYVGEMKGGDVWKRIARLLNPFDWSRLKGMIENVTPQSIMNGAASFLRNPIFEAEADENKKPFVENGVKREQTKLDYLLRFLGWDGPSADNPNIMERLKKTYSQWESGDRTTGWGRITDGYQKLSAADRKGVDWLLYQGDMQGRVFKDFETAVKDPRVSKGKPTETAFTMYQQVRNHIDTVVADTVEAISRQFMYDAGLPDVVIEKHLSDYRNRLAERPGWLPRNHGDGDHQVNVYQHITGLKWETRGDKDSMQALLPYYPSKEVADEIKKLATGYGLKYRNLAGGQQLITTDKNASSRFKKEVAKLKGQIEAATGDEKSKLELQLDAVERQRIFAESMPADQIKRFRTKAAEIIPKLQLRNELGIREREKALKQALEDGESESTINMLKDELKKLGDGRIRVKVYMRLKETKSRAEKHKAEVEKDLQKFMPGNYLDWAKYEVEQRFSDQISEDMYGDMKNDFAMEQGQLAAINKAAAHQEISKKEAAALRQTILQSTAEVLMARGAGAHRIRRAEYLIEGYDAENTVDAYHDYMTGTSGMLSKARYAQEQFEQFRYAKPEVKRWAHTYIVNNLRNMGFADQVSGNMRALATLTYLGFKVSSMLINSTQPWTLGVAELGRHTKRSAVWAIGKAQTDIVIGKLSESEKRLFASEIFKLQEMETAVHEMSGQQEGFTGKVSRFMHTLTDKALMPFQEVELLNRKTVILAAYRTFRADGISRNEALQKALQVNRTVNFEMSRANLPGFAQKPLGRTVYALQSFMWNNWNWIYNRMTSGEKEDMKALLRYAVAMGIIGGAMALPGGDELDKLYQTLFGESPKLALQKWTAKHAKEYGSLGEMVNGFAWHGAASAAGVNISNAIRLQIPIVSPLIGGESLPDAAGGVFTGLVQKGSRATVAASRGDMYRALENLSPEALAGAMRAYRMSTKGATTTSGKILFDEDGKPMKYTAGEAVKRTLGFQPTRVSKRSDLTNIEYGLTAHWKEERGDLLAKLRIATGDERKKVMLKIMRFNRDLRESQAAGLVPIIKEQTIRQALVSKPNKGKMAWEKNQLND